MNHGLGRDGWPSEATVLRGRDEEIRRLKQHRDELLALVRAVSVSEFGGIQCDDVAGVNWFDAARAAIDLAEGGQ